MKQKKIISLVFVAILVMAGLFFIGALAVTSIEAITVQQLDSKLAELAEKEKKFTSLNQSYKEWKNISSIYGDFKNHYFLPYRELNVFKQKLQRVVDQNHLEILKNKSEIKNIQNEFAQVTIHLYLAGPYRLIKSFIYQIEKEKKMVYFRSVELKKNDAGCLGEFILEAYFVR